MTIAHLERRIIVRFLSTHGGVNNAKISIAMRVRGGSVQFLEMETSFGRAGDDSENVRKNLILPKLTVKDLFRFL